MKKIFILFVFVFDLSLSQPIFSQYNYTSGSNNTSARLVIPITIDGNKNDCVRDLNDRGNNSYDNSTDLSTCSEKFFGKVYQVTREVKK